MTAPLIQTYLKNIQAKYATGESKEHSFRGDLENLIKGLFPEIMPLNEFKNVSNSRLCPDLGLKRKDLYIGYIECKDIKKGILDHKDTQAQIKKYFDGGLGYNFILTDHIEFRFYRNGQEIQRIKIAETESNLFNANSHTHEQTIQKITWFIDHQAIERLHTAFINFSQYTGQTVTSSKDLSDRMASKARTIRDAINDILTHDKDQETELYSQYKGFQQTLIHDMTIEDFSDIYAQTVTYGLFAARLHDETLDDFSLNEAYQCLPLSNPFLKKLFKHLADDTEERLKWAIDELIELFKASDVKKLLQTYGKSSRRNDPIVHFYEDFLASYDPALRKARGVWYTPEPVVDFIVRAVDDILINDFALSQGLADFSKTQITVDGHHKGKTVKVKKDVHRVQVLDPATGTGTFLAQTIKHIHEKVQGGMWSQYASEHLIPRLHGFEILMASYAMAHLKLDLLLTETGYKPEKIQRLGVYLTNALEESHPDTNTLFVQWLANEANEANRIKRDNPIMVVMGNPPYSVSSMNKGEWITEQLSAYKKDLKEKNIQPLSDDYIKFLRLAEYYIDKNKQGIVAVITNNSFLDGVIHRQMRKQLLETFDKIYVYDLHGNSKKKEVCPDGSKDENVFDIMQGVSISLFVKTGKKSKKALAQVYHYDAWGKRKEKYAQLLEHSLSEQPHKTVTPWQPLNPVEPHFFFVPKNFAQEDVYKKGFAVNDLMVIKGTGIKFRKDNLLVNKNFHKNDVLQMLKDIHELDKYDLLKKYDFSETDDWKIDDKKQFFDVKDQKSIKKVLYRPFDVRNTFYPIRTINKIINRGDSRLPIMKHFLTEKNWGLMVSKQHNGNGFKYAFLSNIMLSNVSLQIKETTYCLPLYLYDTPLEEKAPELSFFKSDAVKPKRKPNLDSDIVNTLSKSLALSFIPDHEQDGLDLNKSTFNPLDVLDYIYAVLHNPIYRQTYQEFLKIDFPRIPYPKDKEQFWEYVAVGREIRLLHLMESPFLNENLPSYPISGNNKVEKPEYKDGKVYINTDQYFDNVPETAWTFYIGGYQPAQKWLKDRKGRTLSFEDIQHYQKIIRALSETARLMNELKTLS